MARTAADKCTTFEPCNHLFSTKTLQYSILPCRLTSTPTPHHSIPIRRLLPYQYSARTNLIMPRNFEFVTVSKPTEPASSEIRRLAHSHAIRQVHAKKRRLRTQRYQGELDHATPLSLEKLKVPELQVLSPLRLMPGNSKDPFSSLARPLSSEEYFLLNHCRFISGHACCYPGLTPKP